MLGIKLVLGCVDKVPFKSIKAKFKVDAFRISDRAVSKYYGLDLNMSDFFQLYKKKCTTMDDYKHVFCCR